jgi:hypothetical protein
MEQKGQNNAIQFSCFPLYSLFFFSHLLPTPFLLFYLHFMLARKATANLAHQLDSLLVGSLKIQLATIVVCFVHMHIFWKVLCFFVLEGFSYLYCSDFIFLIIWLAFERYDRKKISFFIDLCDLKSEIEIDFQNCDCNIKDVHQSFECEVRFYLLLTLMMENYWFVEIFII